jgi:hypothetical protein
MAEGFDIDHLAKLARLSHSSGEVARTGFNPAASSRAKMNASTGRISQAVSRTGGGSGSLTGAKAQ